MRSHEFKELLDRHSRGEATPEEERLIAAWYDNIKVNADSSDNSSDDVLAQRLWAKVRPMPVRKKQGYVFIKIAASIALIVAVGLSVYLTGNVQISDRTTYSGITNEVSGDLIVYSNFSLGSKTIALPD